ncbi:hypothetical protein K525DRAFT_269490 [Schizophyllum commune Loenen D]|nr:hypothetical protein K525DRAFT_269490 [Schizophyllum commune Loenen D]
MPPALPVELTTRIILDLICEDRALFHDLWMTGSVLGLCCIQYPPNAGFPDLRLVCRLWAAILQALQPQRWRDVYLIPKFTEPSWTSTLDARMPHHFTPMESVMQAFQRSGDLPLQIFVNLSCSDDELCTPILNSVLAQAHRLRTLSIIGIEHIQPGLVHTVQAPILEHVELVWDRAAADPLGGWGMTEIDAVLDRVASCLGPVLGMVSNISLAGHHIGLTILLPPMSPIFTWKTLELMQQTGLRC